MLLMAFSVQAQKLTPYGWNLKTNAVIDGTLSTSNALVVQANAQILQNVSSTLGQFFGNGAGLTNLSYITNFNGIGTNLTTYGSTQYFAIDAPANTNGPLQNYRSYGGNPGISNLITDITLGTVSRYRIIASDAPGDQGYGGLTWTPDHDNPFLPADPARSELGLVSPHYIAIVPGSGLGGGHVQIGSAAGIGSYGGVNLWTFHIQQLTTSQTASTNFSAALAFQTSEAQGVNIVSHYPSILAYSIRTNAPGRWALLLSADLGNNGTETFDPNTAKKMSVFQVQGGDLTNAFFTKPINYATNAGSASIDCSLPRSDVLTAVNITFTSPVNFDVTQRQYEEPLMIITNSALATITLTAPANARLVGTTVVTRQCEVQWRIKIGQYTNGFVTQVF